MIDNNFPLKLEQLYKDLCHVNFEAWRDRKAAARRLSGRIPVHDSYL